MILNRENYVCSICGSRQPRKFVHRKKVGRYICRPCWALQRNAPRLEQIREQLRLKIYRVGYIALLGGAGIALAMTAVYLIVTFVE